MNEIRKADPETRRRAILVIVFATAVGGLLVAGLEHLREPFREWLVSEPAETARRARLAVYLAAAVLSAPVIAFAVYLWLLGARAVRAQEFPPPGVRVVRDTPVVGGQGAVTRGHAIQVIAACLGVAAGVLWVFFIWLAKATGAAA